MSQKAHTLKIEKSELTETERHRLLSDERRQRLLTILEERTEPMELGELATELASRNPALDSDDDETVQRIRVSLHHQHLPMFESFGLIEYDAGANQIL